MGAVRADRARRRRHGDRPDAAAGRDAARPTREPCHDRARHRADGDRRADGCRPRAGPPVEPARPDVVGRLVADMAPARRRHAAVRGVGRPAGLGLRARPRRRAAARRRAGADGSRARLGRPGRGADDRRPGRRGGRRRPVLAHLRGRPQRRAGVPVRDGGGPARDRGRRRRDGGRSGSPGTPSARR